VEVTETVRTVRATGVMGTAEVVGAAEELAVTTETSVVVVLEVQGSGDLAVRVGAMDLHPVQQAGWVEAGVGVEAVG
jgi:hypothetical protein